MPGTPGQDDSCKSASVLFLACKFVIIHDVLEICNFKSFVLPITHIITNRGYLSFYICINYINAHLKILGMPSFLQLG